MYHLSVITASIKHTTGFTHEYLPLVSYYSEIQKVQNRSYSWVFSNHQQSLASSVLLMSHKPKTRVIFKFSWGTKCYSCFFVNLDVSCTVCLQTNMYICLSPNTLLMNVIASYHCDNSYACWLSMSPFYVYYVHKCSPMGAHLCT